MTAMATFEANPHNARARYTQLELKTLTNLDKVKGIFAFGSCCYNGKLYYLFGGLGFDRTLKVRQCTS